MIELRDLRLRRGTTAPITATIRSNAITWISGPNGIGKSSLLLTLLGELAPAGGTISVGTADVSTLTLAERATTFAYAAQQPVFTLPLTVSRVIALSGTAQEHPTVRALGVDGLANATVDALSGGERQRVALAVALTRPTQAVILDEPLASQDAHYRDVIIDLLQHEAAAGKAVVVTSHLPIAGAEQLRLG